MGDFSLGFFANFGSSWGKKHHGQRLNLALIQKGGKGERNASSAKKIFRAGEVRFRVAEKVRDGSGAV
jgi:hypothetical protein